MTNKQANGTDAVVSLRCTRMHMGLHVCSSSPVSFIAILGGETHRITDKLVEYNV